MKKQIILSHQEYEKLCKIASLATILVDKFIQKNVNKGLDHPMDRENVDKDYHELFLKLLYLDESMQNDIIKLLPDNYFEELKIESVILVEKDY